MNKLLFLAAFLLGASAIVWMGLGFAGTNTLAFTVTAVIGGVYLVGIFELFQFRRATTTLTNSLGNITADIEKTRQWLDHWLEKLDSSLQNAVRLRIEGERVGLPAPVFTPYLVGLLVMLYLFLLFFLKIINTWRSSPNHKPGWAWYGGVGGLSIPVIAGMFNTPFYQEHAMLAMLVTGMMFAMSKTGNKT